MPSRPAEIGMVERLVWARRDRGLEFRQGFLEALGLERLQCLAECQLGTEGIDGRTPQGR